ncbi:MAG: hypothetical protein ACK516_04975 [Cyanobium sp.]
MLVRPEALQAALPATLPLGVTNVLPPRPGQSLRHPEAYRAALAGQGVDSPPSLPLRLLQLAGRRSRQPDAARELHTYGPEGHLPRIPAWQVLDPQRWARQPLRPAVRGALVLVGPVVSQGEAGYGRPSAASPAWRCSARRWPIPSRAMAWRSGLPLPGRGRCWLPALSPWPLCWPWAGPPWAGALRC